MANISWVGQVNVSVVGTTMTKTGGAADTPDAGGVSSVPLTGDGYFTITIPAIQQTYVGLDPSPTLITDYTQLNYLFEPRPAGIVNFRENGTYVGENSYSATSVLKFERTTNVVKYYVDGVLSHTSSVASSGDVYLHVLILDVGKTVTAGEIVSSGGTGPTLPEPTTITQSGAPSSYPNAITHKSTITKPGTTPTPPARGGVYYDALYNQNLIRGTDGNTGTLPARLNRSHRLNSSAPTCVWSRDSAYLVGTTPSGAIELFSVDTSYDNALRGRLTHVRDLTFTNEPTFSRVAAGRVYGCETYKVREHIAATNTYNTLIDLAVADPTYAVAPLVMGGSVQSSMSNPERIACFYGGDGADEHFRCMVFDRNTPTNRLILDTQAKTINGVSVPGMGAFWIHSVAFLDGRYVQVNSTQTGGAAIFYIWDTANGTIAEGTGALHANGHSVLTWNGVVNNESFGDSPYFAYQLVRRGMSTLSSYTKVFSSSVGSMIYADSHYCHENARSDVTTPILYTTYRYYEDIADNLNTDPGYRINTAPWGPLDGEVGFVDYTTGNVWRFCHTRANVYADNGATAPSASAFWYQAMAHPSPNGRFIALSTNFEKTLGLDPTPGEPTTAYRSDIWILDTEWVVGNATINATAATSTLTAGPAVASPSSPPSGIWTQITGSLFDARTGSKVTSGRLLIKPNGFINNGNHIVAPKTVAYTIPGSGNISLTLAQSNGVTYTVEFDPNPADTATPLKLKAGYFVNTWTVPISGPVDISML